MKKIVIIALCLAIAFNSCKKSPIIQGPPIPTTFTITSSVKLLAGAEGSTTASSNGISLQVYNGTFDAVKGSDVTVTASPASKSQVTEFLVDSAPMVVIAGNNTYTFSNVRAKHSVSVAFGLIPASSSPTLTADSLSSILYLRNKWLTSSNVLMRFFQSKDYYEYYDDGVNVKRAGTYTWTNDSSGWHLTISIINGSPFTMDFASINDISVTKLTYTIAGAAYTATPQ